jgi:hypothetical protein
VSLCELGSDRFNRPESIGEASLWPEKLARIDAASLRERVLESAKADIGFVIGALAKLDILTADRRRADFF